MQPPPPKNPKATNQIKKSNQQISCFFCYLQDLKSKKAGKYSGEVQVQINDSSRVSA